MPKVTYHMENYAFIDSQNLNLAIRDQGWRLDFRKFRRYLQDKFNVTKAYLFIGYIPQNELLYLRLQQFGYIIVLKPTILHTDGKAKGNTDAELVLHCITEMEHFDRAVIVTGDGDFYCLVDYLTGKDKLLRLLIPNQYKYSSLLRKFRSHIDFMNNLSDKLKL